MSLIITIIHVKTASCLDRFETCAEISQRAGLFKINHLWTLVGAGHTELVLQAWM